MIHLVFAQTAGADPLKVGPFPAFRVEGELLRQSSGSPTIARHSNHLWEVEGRQFFRLDCPGPLNVQFENASGETSRSFGPFQHFSMADGIAYVDRNFFASLAETTGHWYCADIGDWPIMTVSAA